VITSDCLAMDLLRHVGLFLRGGNVHVRSSPVDVYYLVWQEYRIASDNPSVSHVS